MAKLELDLDTLWQTAYEYHGFDYHFTTENPAHRHPNPAAKEGYHDGVLLRGLELEGLAREKDPKAQDCYSLRRADKDYQGGRFKDVGNVIAPQCWADHNEPGGRTPGRRFINCCMFVEAAVIGAAYKMKWVDELRWPKALHDLANNVAPVPAGKFPPDAYVEAGLAEPTGKKPEELELQPNTVYVCQLPSHTFLIIDYDPESKLFLTLEATHTPEFLSLPGEQWFGGVGYRKYGRVEPAPPPRAKWRKKVEENKGESWLDFRKKLVCVTRLHVRKGYVPAVTLPYDAGKSVSPWAHYYHLNEAKGQGGYFPLGMYRNLHGGVHLPLPARPAGSAPEAPVYALAAGEVVALRLGPAKADSSNGRSLELTGNYNGFVLVRHRIAIAGQTLAVYVLYMHLMPKEGARYDAVPWFRRLTRWSNGSLIDVDPSAGEATLGRRRWLAKPLSPGELPGGARVTVWPDDPERPAEEVTLPGPATRTVAVVREVDADVAETLKALDDDSRVATFAVPFLSVQKGELLGFVAPVPAPHRLDPDTGKVLEGFLHWEVLAPVTDEASATAGSDLERLLRLAEDQDRGLGLPAQTFKRVAETKPDNLVQAGELDALMDAAPAGKKPLLRAEYKPAELQALMEAGGTDLPFATAVDAADAPGAKPDYPLTIAVERYEHDGKNTVADGTVLELVMKTDAGEEVLPRPRITLQAGVAEHVVRVPAGARLLRVTQPANLRLELGRRRDDAPDPTPAYFDRLTAARWRRIVLRHVNEWPVDGLVTSLQRRFEHRSPKEVREMAEAIAWWNHAENPITDVTTSAETSLFGTGADQLPAPAATKLDTMNPITFAWVLDRLVAAEKASLAAPRAGSGGRARLGLHLGWLPVETRARPRVAGQEVCAAAIALGEAPEGGPVKLTLKRGKTTLRLDGPWSAVGFLARKVNVPVWDAWELALEVDGVAGVTRPGLLGGPTLEVAPPVPCEGPLPPAERLKDGRFEVRAFFAEGRPEELRGWVFLETQEAAPDGALDPAGWTRAAPGIPITLRARATSLKEADGLYTGGAAAERVSRDFTYGQLCRAAGAPGKPCTVAISLVERVQKAADRVAPTPLSLTKLDRTGVTLVGAPQDRLEALASELGGKVVDRKLRLEGVTPRPDAGVVTGAFAAHEAFRLVLEQAAGLTADEGLHVRFGCLFLNGLAPSDDETIPHVDWAALKGSGEALELAPGKPSHVLRRPGFGAPAWTVRADGAAVVSVPLVGATQALWKTAAPTLTWDQPGALASRADGKTVAATIDLAALRGATVQLRASCAGPMDLDGVKVTVPPLDLAPYSSRAGIDAKLAPTGSSFEVTATLRAWPPGRPVEVRLFDAKGDRVALLADDIKYPSPSRAAAAATGRDKPAAFGLCDGKGAFKATIAASRLVRRLKVEAGQETTFRMELAAPPGHPVLKDVPDPDPFPLGPERLAAPAPETGAKPAVPAGKG